MRVISLRRFREHWEQPGRWDSEQALRTWSNVASKARWSNHADVKASYGASVDLAHGYYVFDIRGNNYCLICRVDFVRHGVLVRWVGKHSEYDALNRNDGKRLRLL